jgi:antitoxin HicB
MKYPITLTPDSNGTLLVTSPDFPELTSFGQTIEDSLKRARGALLEAIEASMHDREDIPQPSRGGHMVRLPAEVAVKVLTYQRVRSDLTRS